MGKEKTLAFLKFMLADVPSAYICICILCGCSERSVVGASEKLATNDRAEKKSEARQTHRRNATPISPPS